MAALCTVLIVAAGCSGPSSPTGSGSGSALVPLGFGGAPASAQGGPRFTSGDGITITGLAIAIEPCTNAGEAQVWNGAGFVCTHASSFLNSAGANVLAKSDGANIVASSGTDDGATVEWSPSSVFSVSQLLRAKKAVSTGVAGTDYNLSVDDLTAHGTLGTGGVIRFKARVSGADTTGSTVALIRSERENTNSGDFASSISFATANAAGTMSKACTISSAKVLDCTTITEGGSAVLSGAISSNVIPKGSGGNLVDSDISSTGTLNTFGDATGDGAHFNGYLEMNGTTISTNYEMFVKPSNAGTNVDLLFRTSDSKDLEINVQGGSTATSISATNGFAFTGAATFSSSVGVATTLSSYTSLSGATNVTGALAAGNSVASTTAADIGWGVGLDRGGGSVYLDSKLGTGASLVGRIGSGTTSGQTNVWLSVTGAGVANFPVSLTEAGSPVLSGAIGANVIPRGSGGNLVDSAISDAGFVDVGRALTRFGSTPGMSFFNENALNFLYNTDADDTGWINQLGFGNNTTRSRSLIIGNGKNAAVATFSGIDKSLTLEGDSTLKGITSVATSTAGVYLNIGRPAGNATNAENGMSIYPFGDGNLYIDHKVYSGGSIIQRFGSGAQSGASANWIIATPGTGSTQIFGSVSIGTNTTSNHFVSGTLEVTDTVGAAFTAAGSLGITTVDNTAQATGVGGLVNFQGKYTNAGAIADGAQIKLFKVNGTDGNYDFNLGFATRSVGGGMTEKLRIASDGTITAFNRLDVDGAIRKVDSDTPATYVEVGQDWGGTNGDFYISTAGSSTDVVFGINGSEAMRIDGDDGFIKIGVNKVTFNTVNGDTIIAGNSTLGDTNADNTFAYGFLRIGYDGTHFLNILPESTTHDTLISASSTGSIYFASYGGNYTRIQTGGDIYSTVGGAWDGSMRFGDAITDAHTINGSVVHANTASARASSLTNYYSITNGSYDATAAGRDVIALLGEATATRSAGANSVINYGAYLTASGGQTNYALFTVSGDIALNVSSGSTTAIRNFTVQGTTTLGDAGADTVDINADLTKFGSTDGFVYITDTINASYSVNGVSTLYLSNTGYQGGTTQFRNTIIRDGKNADILTVTGSSKQVDFAGAVTIATTLAVNGNSTLGDTAASDTTTVNSAAYFNHQVWIGDTANSSIANDLDVVTIGNTGTGQTASGKALLKLTHTGTFGVAGATDVIGESISVTATHASGAGTTTNKALILTASGADGGNYALDFTGGLKANGVDVVTTKSMFLRNPFGSGNTPVWSSLDQVEYDFVRNTAAQSVSETTTPTDSTDLQIGNIAAGETYVVEGLLLLSCNDVAGDTQFRFAASAGAFSGVGSYQSWTTADAVNNGVDSYSGATTTATIQAGCNIDRPHPVRFAYTFSWATSTGTLKVQFSPVTNGAGTQTVTLQKGSYLHFTKII